MAGRLLPPAGEGSRPSAPPPPPPSRRETPRPRARRGSNAGGMNSVTSARGFFSASHGLEDVEGQKSAVGSTGVEAQLRRAVEARSSGPVRRIGCPRAARAPLRAAWKARRAARQVEAGEAGRLLAAALARAARSDSARFSGSTRQRSSSISRMRSLGAATPARWASSRTDRRGRLLSSRRPRKMKIFSSMSASAL